MKKVALIEIGGSHGECLYSQILFFSKANFQVDLLCSDNLVKPMKSIPELSNIHVIDSSKGSWKKAIQIRRILQSNEYKSVVFNTAHGKTIRNLMLLPRLKNQEFTGILHNIKKYKFSGSQNIINRRIKKYFVLGEYLLSKNNLVTNDQIHLDYFYPMFFPEIESQHLDKKEGEVWVCIPGQVENKRRDYTALFEQLRATTLNSNVKFILLGKSKHKHGDGTEIEEKIKELRLEKHFIQWDGFVKEEEFEAYIKQSDYLLPLIHSSKPELCTYIDNQISGTFNLAFGYHKPLLLEEVFQNHPDFAKDVLFYPEKNLVEKINQLAPLQDQMTYTSKRFSFKTQQERYLNLIFSNLH